MSKNVLLKIIKNILFSFKTSYKASKKWCILRVLLQIISAFLPLLILYNSKIILDYITNYNLNKSYSDLITFMVILFCAYVLQSLIRSINNYVYELHNDRINNMMQVKLSKKLLSLDLSHFDTPEFFNEISNTSRDGYAVPTLFFLALDTIKLLVQLASAFIVLCKVNILISFTILMIYIPLFIVNNKYMKFFFEFNRKEVQNIRKRSYFVGILQNKQVAKDEKVMGFGSVFLEKYNMLWNDWFCRKKKYKTKELLLKSLFTIVPELVKVMIFIYIAIEAINGLLTVGDYVLYTGLVIQFATSLSTVILTFSQMSPTSERVEYYKKFFRWESKIKAYGHLIPKENPTIEFKNVSFSYPNTDRLILDNVSFVIHPYEKIAFVGKNGAGKTTIFKLILRLYDVDKGEILVDGINIKMYDIKKYREMYSVFFENLYNYALSVRENVRLSEWGKEEKTDRIMDSIEKAKISNLIRNLPKGIDTEITKLFNLKDGIELSQGEKQKIGIARTWYHQSSIMLFDEPTSNLDAESEKELFSTLETISRNKTIIFISHRLSNVKQADRVIVLDDGHLVENDTHKKLMQTEGVYSKLYSIQSSRYASNE